MTSDVTVIDNRLRALALTIAFNENLDSSWIVMLGFDVS